MSRSKPSSWSHIWSHDWKKPRPVNGKSSLLDAAHFVLFLGFLWSFVRVFLSAPSGRQRFNVRGAPDAITHQIITVTNQRRALSPVSKSRQRFRPGNTVVQVGSL